MKRPCIFPQLQPIAACNSSAFGKPNAYAELLFLFDKDDKVMP